MDEPDAQSIVSGHHSRLRELFDSNYKNKLMRALTQAPFGDNLNDVGFALICATLVAYECGPHLDPDLSEVAEVYSTTDLLAEGRGLTCVRYVDLGLKLFFAMGYPTTDLALTPLGWRQDSPVGRHVQIVASGPAVGNIALLLDPTHGLVATDGPGGRLDSYGVLSGRGGTLGPELSIRAHPSTDGSTQTRATVSGAIRNGSCGYRDLIFAYNASSSKTVHTHDDFIYRIRPGYAGTIFHIDTAHRLWRIDDDGITPAGDGRRYKSIVPHSVADCIYTLDFPANGTPDHAGAVRSITDGGSDLITFSTQAIVGTNDGAAAHFVNTAKTMHQISGGGIAVNCVGVDTIVQGNDLAAIYYRSLDEVFWINAGVMGSGPVYADVTEIIALRGRRDGCGILLLRTNGDLALVDPAVSAGAEVFLAPGVTKALVGLDGATITTLHEGGVVSQVRIYDLYRMGGTAATTKLDWSGVTDIRFTASGQLVEGIGGGSPAPTAPANCF